MDLAPVVTQWRRVGSRCIAWGQEADALAGQDGSGQGVGNVPSQDKLDPNLRVELEIHVRG